MATITSESNYEMILSAYGLDLGFQTLLCTFVANGPGL